LLPLVSLKCSLRLAKRQRILKPINLLLVSQLYSVFAFLHDIFIIKEIQPRNTIAVLIDCISSLFLSASKSRVLAHNTHCKLVPDERYAPGTCLWLWRAWPLSTQRGHTLFSNPTSADALVITWSSNLSWNKFLRRSKSHLYSIWCVEPNLLSVAFKNAKWIVEFIRQCMSSCPVRKDQVYNRNFVSSRPQEFFTLFPKPFLRNGKYCSNSRTTKRWQIHVL